MSAPLTTPEFMDADPDTPDALYVGDYKDDDGAVIDSLMIETNAPATPVVQPLKVVPLQEPQRYGRLFTGSILATLDMVSPYRILPADPKRKSIVISAFSTAVDPEALAEYVTLADENGVTASTSGAYRLRHGKDPLTLSDYSGAIYILPAPSITAGIEISWVAVTV